MAKYFSAFWPVKFIFLLFLEGNNIKILIIFSHILRGLSTVVFSSIGICPRYPDMTDREKPIWMLAQCSARLVWIMRAFFLNGDICVSTGLDKSQRPVVHDDQKFDSSEINFFETLPTWKLNKRFHNRKMTKDQSSTKKKKMSGMKSREWRGWQQDDLLREKWKTTKPKRRWTYPRESIVRPATNVRPCDPFVDLNSFLSSFVIDYPFLFFILLAPKKWRWIRMNSNSIRSGCTTKK